VSTSRRSTVRPRTPLAGLPVRSISRIWARAGRSSSRTSSTMRSHSSRRMQRKKRSARCSTAAGSFAGKTRSQIWGTANPQRPSMNSGNRCPRRSWDAGRSLVPAKLRNRVHRSAHF